MPLRGTLALGLIYCAAAYLAGSLNFSILVFRLLGRGDPRTQESGNPGVSNVYRLAGPGWAGLVLALDLGRAGAVAVLAESWLPRPGAPWVGLALLLGNRWPLFHGLRGGKGVAALLGFTTALEPLFGAGASAAWLAVFAALRVSFLGSFAMTAVLASGLLWHTRAALPGVPAVAIMALLVLWAHRPNLRRLRDLGLRGYRSKSCES